MPIFSGHVFWIFGLSGAGKTTLATALTDSLRTSGIPVLALDADILRAGLCRDLGFSDRDRTENLSRAAEVARLGMDSGLCVVAAFITPFELHRQQIREVVGADRLSLVFADAPLEVCNRRDPKGLYARAHTGEVMQMTGVSSPFEHPTETDLTLPTATISPANSSQALLYFALSRLSQTQKEWHEPFLPKLRS